MTMRKVLNIEEKEQTYSPIYIYTIYIKWEEAALRPLSLLRPVVAGMGDLRFFGGG